MVVCRREQEEERRQGETKKYKKEGREGESRKEEGYAGAQSALCPFFWVDVLLSLFFASREHEQQGSEVRAQSGKRERGGNEVKEGRKEGKKEPSKEGCLSPILIDFFLFFSFLLNAKRRQTKGEGTPSSVFFWDEKESSYVAWAPGKWRLV